MTCGIDTGKPCLQVYDGLFALRQSVLTHSGNHHRQAHSTELFGRSLVLESYFLRCAVSIGNFRERLVTTKRHFQILAHIQPDYLEYLPDLFITAITFPELSRGLLYSNCPTPFSRRRKSHKRSLSLKWHL